MPLKCPYTTKAIALIGYRLDNIILIYIYQCLSGLDPGV